MPNRFGRKAEKSFAWVIDRIWPIPVLALIQPIGMHTAVIRGVEDLQETISVQIDGNRIRHAALDHMPIL
jgi:hypothetical protein